jgi:peptide/nickel transport system substrate-binding protein
MKEQIKQILNKKWGVEVFEKLSNIIKGFSISEKLFFYSLCILFVSSGLVILNQVNNSVSVQVPTNGGYLKEGIIGSPRFVNPVLALSDVDHDLTSLIYSGLMKSSENNTLVTDLAKSYDVSSDGLTYTFTMRDDIYFHDGEKVTADDVEFTINKIQDSMIKSPKRPGFYDVRVEKIDEKNIKFILKKPYSPFLENLTIGIIPKHLWDNLSSDQFPLSQYNVEPIGSGPYKVTKMDTLKKNMLLIPTYYELNAFDKYVTGKPFIEQLILNFYKDEKTLITAYNNKEVESINSVSPNKIADIKKQKNSEVKTSPLPRVFAVFFNPNQSEALAYKEVRQALNLAVDRNKIVNDVLSGYGKPLYGPIPAGLIEDQSYNKENYNIDAAMDLLTKGGWVKSSSTGITSKKINKTKTIQLSVVISTLNSDDLVKTAELIKSDWEKIGAQVEIKQFDFGDLQQNIIRPRKFESLLYGEVIGRDMDLFAFWHSSQRNDPGLNIAMYTNTKVDKLLEDARKTLDTSSRIDKYKAFSEELKKDVPAIFLYSPEFIYIVPAKIQGFKLGSVTLPFERFLNITNWYIETNNLWKVFIPQRISQE